MKTERVLLLSLLIVVLLVGGGIGAVVVNNRMVSDRQARAAAQKAADAKKAKEDAEGLEYVRSLARSACLQRAEDAYWTYVKLNATNSKQQADGTIVYTAFQDVWDNAERQRQSAKSDCYVNP
jgi:hypothetical protein